MAQSFFGDIGFWATDSMTSGPPPAGGQGFSMSSDEMHALLSKAQGQRQTIQEQLDKAHILSQVDPPAEEPASTNAVKGPNGVNETGRYYEGHLRYQFNYLSELIERMQKALGIVVAADQQAGDAAKKAGGEFE